MINRQELLKDLQRLLRQLEADLRERCKVPEIGAAVKAEFEQAKQAKRTGQSFEEWRADYMTQIGAAWVLSCVFARFLEDNELVDPPKLSGPGERLQRARDEYDLYVHEHPADTVREYLLFVFDGLAELPGGQDVFGKHNLVHEQRGWISGDAAKELRNFWQRIDPVSGDLIHDFTDAEWDTRFLGDLYQDLSEAARKKYALLQTPEFVEEFILERTLEPALDEFGLVVSGQWSVVSGESNGGPVYSTANCQLTTDNLFKMIDPACGSGHFLLGSFRRILERWQRLEPGTNVRELVQRTLSSVHGVDVNPFAIAIARFRLLLAAMRAVGIERLADAPAFRLNLVCGDSLLHAPLAGGQQVFDFDLVADDASLVTGHSSLANDKGQMTNDQPANDKGQMTNDNSDECDHAYRSENLPELKRLLRGGQYHAVVANPPYIVPRDKQLNDRYRKRFASCHRQYSLAVPFLERIFRLAVAGGYTGQITANSFMKREFGKKLIETFFLSIDLTHVVDTSGAYIPGHGTPTVILFGRHRPPVACTLRTVMGIRGEPSTPADPARGLVWSAIVGQLDQPGSQSEFVSVGDSPRELFHKHPWSIGGGGASDLKARLDESATVHVGESVDEIGFGAVTRDDDAFVVSERAARRSGIEPKFIHDFITGENVRDWTTCDADGAIWPYDPESLEPLASPATNRFLWRFRPQLCGRSAYGQTQLERGLKWFEYSMFFKNRFRSRQLIAFAAVATHNHFFLSDGGRLFNRHAPVIKLPREASEDDHLALLGILNSSIACFWMKQIFHDKGSTVDAHGARQTTVAFENFREFTGTGLLKFPLPVDRPLLTARLLDNLATRARDFQPASIASRGAPTRAALATAQSAAQLARSQMIAAQEELDWECYRLYGLIEEELISTQRHRGHGENAEPSSVNSVPLCFPPLQLGQRAFEIVLARKMAAGETHTTWFERHGSTPITELPAEWPDDYRQLVERRIALIESDPNIRLIEQPEYKRRWNTEPWDSQLERALREWLLDRLESYFDFDGRMSVLDPEGISAISRGLSAATPPETNAPTLADPGGVTAPGAATPSGSNGMARDPDPGCAARPGANGLNPSGIKPLEIALVSVAGLADIAARDAEFMEVAALYRDRPDFDILRVVADLVADESVPLLPVLRYKPDAMDKRWAWERTWDLQRREDRGESVGEIPVPPKYKSSDFQSSTYWRLRGKLDVPKERWVSFPHCEGEDQSLVIAWAGYDHLQLTKAVSAFFADVQATGGSEDPRLVPLLGCVLELNPWVKQWHNDVDPDFGYRLGDYFANFVEDEARTLGKTVDDVRQWTPPAKTKTRKKKS